MRFPAILTIFLFLFSSVSAQNLDINSFKKGKKVKVKNLRNSKSPISLDQKRAKQKGIIISLLASSYPKGQEIKVNYTDESLIGYGFGFYLGIGSTYTFHSTFYDGTNYYLASIEEFDSNFGSRDLYYDLFEPQKYITLGVSKNFNLKHTLYTGYGRVIGVERDDGTGLFDGTTRGYEEMHIIDLGYIFKTKSIALTLGLPLHLPRFKIPDDLYEGAGYGGARFRPQIGIGYIL